MGIYNAPDEMTELMKAVNSIPAYIERSTHFFALCPTVQHAELSGVLCDFGSWQSRASDPAARLARRCV